MNKKIWILYLGSFLTGCICALAMGLWLCPEECQDLSSYYPYLFTRLQHTQLSLTYTWIHISRIRYCETLLLWLLLHIIKEKVSKALLYLFLTAKTTAAVLGLQGLLYAYQLKGIPLAALFILPILLLEYLRCKVLWETKNIKKEKHIYNIVLHLIVSNVYTFAGILLEIFAINKGFLWIAGNYIL